LIKNLFLSIFLFLFPSFLFAQNLTPVSSSDCQGINHKAYSLCYSESHEQAEWVFYAITKSNLKGTYKRSNDFRPDPKVRTGSASLADYRGSGFDRGHLCPAAVNKWSASAMSESFYMSNMSPQWPGFNRGIWKRLESQVRTWAYKNDKIYVVSGPILRPGLSKIGRNGVSVPESYYKAILDTKEPEIKAIGFVLPNKKSGADLKGFAVPIDVIENLTGIDFFAGLDDGVEDRLESSLNLTKWSFKPVKRYKKKSSSSSSIKEKRSYAGRCLGTTKSGRRCKRKTKDISGYCYQHEYQKR